MNDTDRYHGMHTQECWEYAARTMKDCGQAHCIVQCADARSKRLLEDAFGDGLSGAIDKVRALYDDTRLTPEASAGVWRCLSILVEERRLRASKGEQ